MNALRERGVALITAMLTVALVASLATAALWQQWRSVEIEAAERGRTQAAWILTGALDWARLILREDARAGGADHLGEPWAVALQEARLSTFLAAEGTVASESDTTFLSGQILDMQSQLNVTNLVEAGRISEPGLAAFTRLFELLGLPRNELVQLAENLRFASDISTDNRSAPQAVLLPQRVEHLAWLGLSVQTVAVLEPYVTVLPQRSGVNLNTASAEVIYAAVPGLSQADAQRLVAERDRGHFRTTSDAARLVPGATDGFTSDMVTVASRFFEVRGRLRMGDTVVEERSLVRRDGIEVRALQRERGVVDPTALTQAALQPPVPPTR